MKCYSKKYKILVFSYTGLFLATTIIPYMLELVSSGIVFIGVGIQQLLFAYNAYKLKQNGNLIFNICAALLFIVFSIYALSTGRG